MVMGTSSGAGKSFLATALCRYYASKGLRVAPFKAQNMSNNARAIAGGCELASAQYYQALAAKCVPDPRMCPVLLKPESERSSQVVLLGRVDAELSRVPWRARAEMVWPAVAEALDGLISEYDVVVIEGAGSPVEINLRDCDYTNLRVALHANAKCLLVCDIDRGGAFAHLYGTWSLMDERERGLMSAFVLNKFRGDPLLLEPGPAMLKGLCEGTEIAAVLPMWFDHGLPEEDGMLHMHASSKRASYTIAIVVYPAISNLDEFHPLTCHPSLRVCWARHVDAVLDADLIILPGSKNPASDCEWLREHGWNEALVRWSKENKPLLGICGGLQMLGRILEPDVGLSLLDVETEFEENKLVQSCEVTFGALSGYWAPLSSLSMSGYEIHTGRSRTLPGDTVEVVPSMAWQRGSVLGIYMHGLFEDTTVLETLFGPGSVNDLDETLDGLATFITKHFADDFLDNLISTAARSEMTPKNP